MPTYDTADGVAAPPAADSTSQEAGSDERGLAIITQPETPVTVVADMTVGAKRIADEINEQHWLARDKFAEHAVECGRLLLAQKLRVGHGNFGKWIEANCEFSVATANNYMKVAKNPSALGKSGALRRLYLSGCADAPKKISAEKPAKTMAAKPVGTETNVTKSAPVVIVDPIQEPCADCVTDEERWQRSAANFLGDLLAMRAYWSKEFGEWERFKRPSMLVSLAEQAAKEWKELAKAVQDPATTTVEDAIKALIAKTGTKYSGAISAVRTSRSRVTKLQNQLIEARNDLARAEAAMMKAAKELQE